MTRLEEKQQLAELNKRLEHYILRQREKDANQGILEKELEAFRDQAEAEMEQAQGLWNDQLAKTRRERDDYSSQTARLTSELDRLRRQLEDARMEAKKAEDDNERLREQAQGKGHRCSAARCEPTPDTPRVQTSGGRPHAGQGGPGVAALARQRGRYGDCLWAGLQGCRAAGRC